MFDPCQNNDKGNQKKAVLNISVITSLSAKQVT